MQGKYVLIRAIGAGVHFGTLISKEGKEVHLKNARRLWSWMGALSLSEVATKGIDIAKSKISECVEEIIVNDVVETIFISKKSNLNQYEVSDKKIFTES